MILFSMFSTCSIHLFHTYIYLSDVLFYSIMWLCSVGRCYCCCCFLMHACTASAAWISMMLLADPKPNRTHLLLPLLVYASLYLLLIYKRSMIIKSAVEQHQVALCCTMGKEIAFDVDDEDDKLNLYLI